MITPEQSQESQSEECLISVVVPAYNIESYLGRTLDSILAQTYTHLEIIVVNDGSTDNTGRVVDQYAANNSRVVAIHKKNEGVSVARNVGIERAQGDYIGFVDGDDTIEPDMFEFLLDNAIKYDADISHCGHTMITEAGDVPHYGTGKVKLQDTTTGVLDLLEGTLVDPGLWTKIYKRHLFDGLSLAEGIRINEDLLINYYLFKKARYSYFVDVSKYSYIKRSGSASMTEIAPFKLRDQFRVAREIMEDSKDDDGIFERSEYRFLMTLFETCKVLTITDNPALSEVKLEMYSELSLQRKRYSQNRLIDGKYRLYLLLLVYWPLSFKLLHKIYVAAGRRSTQ